MTRVVIDSNVLVSRYLAPAGPPARLLRLWGAGRFALLVSEPILAEDAQVLAYDKLR